ncbi:hypothetical protein Stube_54290 [Streptomyces tubercidicus]|uniref:Uncharacterized protein n=1 Tax=Streptomyces tubercidicus TaxID=47759 RepID=A0A640V3M5_9ACTN|nr:hypothetical protein Stube_54290 [Streptomyces tubercidicus]
MRPRGHRFGRQRLGRQWVGRKRVPIARSVAKPRRCRATARPLVQALANIDIWLRPRSRVTAVPAAAPRAVFARPAADGRASARAAMSSLIEAPARATAPRVTTADLLIAGR